MWSPLHGAECDRPRTRGQPGNDGHQSPWQAAVGHEIIPDTHKNGCVFAVRHPGPLGIINRPWPQQIADWRRIGEAVLLSLGWLWQPARHSGASLGCLLRAAPESRG